VANGRKPECRTVEIGEFNDEFIEIKNGLKEGERVLLRRRWKVNRPRRLMRSRSRRRRASRLTTAGQPLLRGCAKDQGLMAASIVQLHEIRKTYQMGLVTVEALRGVSIDICAAEYVSIWAHPAAASPPCSISWAGLDRPSSGRYVLGSEDISLLDDNALSSVRAPARVQSFSPTTLIQQLTVVENIEVPPITRLAGGGEPQFGERRGNARGPRRPPRPQAL